MTFVLKNCFDGPKYRVYVKQKKGMAVILALTSSESSESHYPRYLWN